MGLRFDFSYSEGVPRVGEVLMKSRNHADNFNHCRKKLEPCNRCEGWRRADRVTGFSYMIVEG